MSDSWSNFLLNWAKWFCRVGFDNKIKTLHQIVRDLRQIQRFTQLEEIEIELKQKIHIYLN